MVAIGDLREIWNDDEMRRCFPALTEGQIRFARRHLLRTMSLLAYLDIPDVDRILLDLMGSTERARREFDGVLHTGEGSTLGLGHKQSLFELARPRFTAPVLTEGEDFALKGAQEMPLVGPSEPRRQGMNRLPVTRHAIARGHLNRRNRVGPSALG